MKSYTVYTLIISVALLFTVELSAQQTTLFNAVKSNNIKEVKLLLDKGDNPNAYDDDSDNVLMNAALFASADCMKLLLQNKANPNLKNKYGETALMLCTGDLDKMKLLLHYGANINDTAFSGNNALMIACIAGSPYTIVKWLIDNGANPKAKRWNAETALMRAAQYGDTMTIHLLLSKGLDINEHPWGYTPLMYAARTANWQAIFCLLNNGADANIPDPNNTTILLWAAEQNNLEAVKAVIKKTKNINTVDSLAGMTPLMWAAYNEHDNPQIIQTLLNNGALVNIKSKDGSTALTWAMKKGNTATVALLKQAGAE
ncbi:MAG TPA: ankyrin repeat domain-containing protein [Parafilimonas sp.]|jgi:ankyrin repeat protein|nr:ankyrin repeat domain-containing protein [Parafilimonas sp.]